MMKHLLLLSTLLLMTALPILAQTTIEGTVTDGKGNTLPGANIYIENTYDGGSTDMDGAFSFKTAEKGAQKLVVSMIGFHGYTQSITCEGEKISLNITLKEKIDQMNAVTITAGAMEASDMKKSVVMKPTDIVTTSGAVGDIVGALNKLPGTSTVGNDGRLFVRGGDASETNIYFDGLQVGNAYGSTAQNMPTRSRFNAELFKGSFFSTGGYSAEYGQALSSALVLNTVDMPLRNQADISLMSIGGEYTQSLVGKRNALTGTIGFMDLGPYQSLINQNFDWDRAPHSWNAELLGRQKYGKSGLVKGFVHAEQMQFALNQEQPGTTEKQSIDMDNHYYFGNASFKQGLGDTWTINGGVSYSDNTDDIQINDNSYSLRNQFNHAKVVAVKDFSDRIALKNGIEYYYNTYTERNNEDRTERSFTDQQLNHFIEMDWYLSKKLVMRAGLRSTYSELINKGWATPRASLAYKTSENGQVSFAYGTFKQFAKNEIRVQAPESTNTEAEHFILNYMYAQNGRTFRVEGFQKNYDKLIQYESFQNNNYTGISNTGSGYSRGLDLFYRDNRTFKETDFWVTYSFVDSKRSYNGFENQVQPGFAPKHNASVVAKHFVPFLNSQIGGSYSWNSGYTYHNPNLAGEMQEKTGNYNNLSLSWSYLPKPNIIIHFECSNVLGTDNIFGYEYANQADANGNYAALPVQQSADRFIFLGVFITLSKDKNANMLNNL